MPEASSRCLGRPQFMHLSPIPNFHRHAGHLTANIKKKEYPATPIAHASDANTKTSAILLVDFGKNVRTITRTTANGARATALYHLLKNCCRAAIRARLGTLSRHLISASRSSFNRCFAWICRRPSSALRALLASDVSCACSSAKYNNSSSVLRRYSSIRLSNSTRGMLTFAGYSHKHFVQGSNWRNIAIALTDPQKGE